MNTLCRLILEHLFKAGSNPVASAALFMELCEMTHPRSTDLDWEIATGFLVKKGFIAIDQDELTAEKMFYITKSGRVVHARRNPEQEQRA